ncbi:MAG: hypothetical protein RLY16_291 [Bacteroidota bacterium]
MKRLISFLLFFPLITNAQNITFSDPIKDEGRNMNFHIIGKMNNHVFVLKSLGWRHDLAVFDDSMHLKETIDLDFLPNRTLNVDYVALNDGFHIVYQYQKKSIVYCMSVKFDANGKKQSEPILMDTTQLKGLGDNKIYSLLRSDNKQYIMIFKIIKNDQQLDYGTLLYDNQLRLQKKSYLSMPYDSKRDVYNEFLLDNEGNLVFVGTKNDMKRGYANTIYLIQKPAALDLFITKKLQIDSAYVDDIIFKIDNLNKKYIIASFYNIERGGDVDGIFLTSWDPVTDKSVYTSFVVLEDSIRSLAKTSGSNKTIFNDFTLQNIFLKKDGGYLLTAEYITTQNSNTGASNWNRNDFWGINNNMYYFYDPFYRSYYRPLNSFGANNFSTTRHYYENVILLSIDKTGDPQWESVLSKQQSSDEGDNQLSFGNFFTNDGLHFIYNDITKREKLLMQVVFTAMGNQKRLPSLKTYERGVEFMPRFCKQVGPRQVIVPANYRGQIVFARIDF